MALSRHDEFQSFDKQPDVVARFQVAPLLYISLDPSVFQVHDSPCTINKQADARRTGEKVIEQEKKAREEAEKRTPPGQAPAPAPSPGPTVGPPAPSPKPPDAAQKK